MMVKLAWQALVSRKLRAVLTILGIVVGPALIVGLVGATEGFKVSVEERFSNMGLNTMFVFRSFRGGGTNIDHRVVDQVEGIRGVALAVPFYRISGTIRVGSDTQSITVIALDLTKLQTIFPGVQVREGEIPGVSALNHALVGGSVGDPDGGAAVLYTVNSVVSTSFNTRVGGETIRGTRSFVVAGVMEPFGQGFFINPDETIFINTLAGQSLTRQQTFSGIFVVARSAEDVDLVINSIQERYGRGLRVFASSTFLNSIRSVNEGISTILTSVAFMAVLVAFIGIMTTMFTSVAERTREIGILKSVGFRKRHIMGIFLAESSLTGLLGGIVGVGLGIVLSYTVIGIFGGNLGVGGGGFGRRSGTAPPALDIAPVITPELLIGTVLLALGIGALAGILPAWRASKLIPVEALKHE